MADREYPCGCRMGVGRRAGFHYCPLHKAAPDLYEALKDVLWDLKQGAIPNDLTFIEQALAKAEKV